MKIVGIIARINENVDKKYNFECLEAVSRIFSKYEDVVPIMILPTKDVLYNNLDPNEEILYEVDKLKKLDHVLDKCDGFLLPGGSEWYSHDEYIVNYAINKDKPLLGICLGMQIMGVMNSRSNLDDFDSTKINQTDINHNQPDTNYVHDVKIMDNTLLMKILNKKIIKVNSRHNYHIDKIVDFNINAVSEDGLIEGIEIPNKKFILGVQWHPENLIELDEDSKKIFDYFLSKL